MRQPLEYIFPDPPMGIDPKALDQSRIPRHVAVIMDGNGRWAKERGLERSEGHRKGLDVVHEITDAAAEVGVQYLTLYAFSTENWNRPQAEVDALMALVVFGIERETPGMVEKGVRLSVIGDLDRLPSDVKARLLKCIRDTSGGCLLYTSPSPRDS